MTAIGIFSVKGSPGATSLALALAAHGRERGAVLIEADAAGGDVALRFGIAQHPGLAQLAARVRHTGGGRDVIEGLVRTTGSAGSEAAHVVPAPVEPAAVTAALDALATRPQAIGDVARSRPVLLDCGRLDPDAPAYALFASCPVKVLVVRGDAVSLGHAREAGWVSDLPGLGFVLIDTGPYRAAEAVSVLQIPCFGTVPAARKPLRGRRAALAVRAVWDAVAEPASEPREPAAVPELAQVSAR